VCAGDEFCQISLTPTPVLELNLLVRPFIGNILGAVGSEN